VLSGGIDALADARRQVTSNAVAERSTDTDGLVVIAEVLV
jgi:hypothetical protein